MGHYAAGVGGGRGVFEPHEFYLLIFPLVFFHHVQHSSRNGWAQRRKRKLLRGNVHSDWAKSKIRGTRWKIIFRLFRFRYVLFRFDGLVSFRFGFVSLWFRFAFLNWFCFDLIWFGFGFVSFWFRFAKYSSKPLLVRIQGDSK